MQKQNVCSTRCSQVVSLPSTDRARPSLTSVIERERVYSQWYGRRQTHSVSGHSASLQERFHQYLLLSIQYLARSICSKG